MQKHHVNKLAMSDFNKQEVEEDADGKGTASGEGDGNFG
jgi:hypothetical protein